MSRDGRRVAFATWVDGKNVVVVDGRPGEAFDFVSPPFALSDDGEVVAYAARRGAEQFCVAGGRKSAPYREVGSPVLSADGQVVAFPASDGLSWFVVLDGRAGPRYEWVGKLVLHPGGRSLAYVAQRGRCSFVVQDGREGPPFDRVTAPAISPDGRVVAYGGRRDGEWYVVLGGRETPAEGEVASVFVEAEGRRAGCVVEEGGRFFVVGPGGRGAFYDWVGWPALSPDGRAVYLASRGAMKFLVADEAALELGEWVVWDLELSPDGSRAGFGARIGRRLVWKVLPVPNSNQGLSKHKEGKP